MEEEKKEKNGFISKIFSKVTACEFLKNGKFKILIAVILMFVVLIIFASSFFDSGSSKVKQTSNETKFTSMEYCEVLENRLVNVLSCIKGVGDVKVFVMVDSSPEIKFLEEQNSSSTQNGENSIESIQTTIVMAKDGSVTSPIVTIELLPKITGVLIVASGASDIKLKTTLINATASVLSVNISNVEVLEGK